jgi:2-iminoacetate synthase ThiH
MELYKQTYKHIIVQNLTGIGAFTQFISCTFPNPKYLTVNSMYYNNNTDADLSFLHCSNLVSNTSTNIIAPIVDRGFQNITVFNLSGNNITGTFYFEIRDSAGNFNNALDGTIFVELIFSN